MTAVKFELPPPDPTTIDLTRHAVRRVMQVLDDTQVLSGSHQDAALIAIMVASAVIGSACGHLARSAADHPELQNNTMLNWADAVLKHVREEMATDERANFTLAQYRQSKK